MKNIWKKKKKLEEENLIKKEEERIKNIEKYNTIQRKMRIAEYQNQLRMDELEEKDKKIQEFKTQREKLTQQRIETSIEIQKKKRRNIEKIRQFNEAKQRNRPRNYKRSIP